MILALISDIHIRLNSRIDEYNTVFDNLYTQLKSKNIDRILILGDLFHNKTTLSPEAINCTSNFLSKLSDITVVDLIAGNHDIGKIYDRMDSIEPIINLLQNTKNPINYYNKSGIYNIEKNYDYYVYDFRDRENFPIVNGSDNSRIKIGLYHGVPFNKTFIDKKSTLDANIDSNVFTGLDFLFCGDIHKMQYFNNEKTKLMCGSLIQQNFGEAVDDHGFHIFDLDNKDTSFFPIENDFSFITLTDNDFLFDDKIELLTSKSYKDCKVRCILEKDYTSDEIAKIKKELKLKLKKDIPIQYKMELKNNIKQFDVVDLSNVSVQNKLISDYCKENKISDVDKIIEVNEKINSEINLKENVYFSHWYPIKLKFKNMFSFGEDEQVIDFSTLKGITGIIGKNARGKSSIFSIILFALYANGPKIEEASNVINTSKDEAFVELTLSINNEMYRITRIITRKKKSALTDLKFEKFNEEINDYIRVDGDTNTDTKKIISKLLGSYDDVITSTFSLQDDAANFLKRGETKRKEFIYNSIGLNVFENLYKGSAKYESDADASLKIYKETDFDEKIDEFSKKENEYSEAIWNNTIKKEKLENESIDLEKNIADYNLKIDTIKLKDTSALELDELNNNIKKLKSTISINDKEIDNIKKSIDSILTDINKMKSIDVLSETARVNDEIIKLNELIKESELNLSSTKTDRLELESKVEFNNNILEKINFINSKLIETSTKIENYKRQTEILEKQPWMITIDSCKNCELASDAFIANDKLQELNKFVDECNTLKNECNSKYNSNLNSDISSKLKYESTVQKDISNNNTSILNLTKIQKNLELLDTEIKNKEENLTIKQENLNKLLNANTDLNNNLLELNTKYNKLNVKSTLNLELEKYKIEKDNLLDKKKSIINEIKAIETKINDNNRTIGALQSDISKLKESQKLYLKALENKQLYETYRSIVNKNGIPLSTLKELIPAINYKISEYLNDISEFSINFEFDDDKLKVLISKSDTDIRDIRSASGFEITNTSWIIRAVLSEFSILPKSEMFIIDEGFGSSDQDNLSNMDVLFDKLKQKFSQILIVSHIPQISDFCDNLLEIYFDDNKFSQIKM